MRCKTMAFSDAEICESFLEDACGSTVGGRKEPHYVSRGYRVTESPAVIRERNKAYYAANKDSESERQRAWRADNPGYQAAYMREYRARNPEYDASQKRRRRHSVPRKDPPALRAGDKSRFD